MGRLRVLHLEKLPDTLVVTDSNLMERFGREASSLDSLSICDMALTTPETKKVMATLIITILESKTTPSTLNFCNLEFETSEFEEIFDKLLSKEAISIENKDGYQSECITLVDIKLPPYYERVFIPIDTTRRISL